jgi:hypothetical protein
MIVPVIGRLRAYRAETVHVVQSLRETGSKHMLMERLKEPEFFSDTGKADRMGEC